MRTFTVMERRLAALLGDHGLTVAQFDVLATLRFAEGVTQQELARRLLVTKGNVCGLIDRLERSGWVERRADAADARANRIHLTQAGRRKLESVLPAHDTLVHGLLGGIDDADLRATRDTLVAIEQAAEAG